MDLEYFTPDNDSASEMQQSEVVFLFLFPANEQLAKTIEPGKSDFNDPSPGFLALLLLCFFLSSGTYMRRVCTLSHCLVSGGTRIGGICAKVLWSMFRYLWACDDNCVQTSNLTSWVFAPDMTTAKGTPLLSTNILRFVPIFSPISWIVSN